MPRFMLTHSHLPSECRIAFAAWRGFESPLRHDPAISSCGSADGDRRAAHRIWWTVEAEDQEAALALLPPFVAERTDVNPIEEVPIP